MSRPRLLDLFSCAGGAAMGYHRAGIGRAYLAGAGTLGAVA
ncbi:hypothetical protein ABZT04_29140 [Streptomyces sp. NPDC005492]